MQKVKFDIQGMTCSSCSAHVDRAVNKLEGVKTVNVNLLSNNMMVEFDEKMTNIDKIIKAVVDAGYGATVSDERKKETSKKEKKLNNEDVIKSMKKRLIISICFLVPLMYIAMYHMLNEWFGIPIPSIVNSLFHGTENAITFGFTQFLLLLPIVYVNRNYFIVGFKRLLKESPNMDSLIAIGSSAAIVYGIFAIYMIGYGYQNNNLDIVNDYRHNLYFESASMILTLVSLGKYLEGLSKKKTTKAISELMSLVPEEATVLRNDKEVKIKASDVKVDDILIIRKGENLAVDALIIEGEGSFNEANITGESLPKEKTLGDSLYSSSIMEAGFVKAKAIFS